MTRNALFTTFKYTEVISHFLGRWYSRLAITLILFCAVVYAYWPGGMSVDTYVQFNQAVSGNYTDWHPPVMSWVWSKLLVFDKAPAADHSAGPMLIFHMAMLFAASFLMSCYRTIGKNFPWLWCVFPLVPWILCTAGMIWKDVGMAFALFLSFASLRLLIQNINNKLKPISFFYATLSFVGLLYAVLVRHNAIFAVFPMIYYILSIFCRKRNTIILVILTSCCCVILIGFIHIYNFNFLNAEKTCSEQVMMIDEIAAASQYDNSNLFIIYPHNSYEFDKLPTDFNKFPKDDMRWKFYRSKDIKLLKVNYRRVIRYNTISWIRGKQRRINQFFTSNPDFFSFIWDEGRSGKNYAGVNGVFKKIKLICTSFEKNINFLCKRLYILILGCCIFIIALLYQSFSSFQAKILTSSGLFYSISYMLVTPTSSFRFTYWSFIAISMGFFILVKDLCYRLFVYRLRISSLKRKKWRFKQSLKRIILGHS